MVQKIFNISFHKNGTTSFNAFMKMHNLKSFHNTAKFSNNIMGFQNMRENNIIEDYANKNIDLHPSIKIKNSINYDYR